MSERASHPAKRQDIESILGRIDDASMTAILAIGPSVNELDEAVVMPAAGPGRACSTSKGS